MNTAYKCSQSPYSSWHGRIPYLYYQFLNTGKPKQEFSKWISLFRGSERQEDDIAQYLLECLNIKIVSLSKEANSVSSKLRWATERLWSESHRERRRWVIEVGDDSTTQQLIKNDVESYLGVIALRQEDQKSELGYKHWLLTLDSIAWYIRNRLKDEFQNQTPPSPLLSLDFLVNNLTFGPQRQCITRSDDKILPVILDVEMIESMPEHILEIAEQVRQDNDGLPEYVIRRKVRDEIDKARRRRKCFGVNIDYDTKDNEKLRFIDLEKI